MFDLGFSYYYFLFSFLELGIVVNILPTCISLPCVRISLGTDSCSKQEMEFGLHMFRCYLLLHFPRIYLLLSTNEVAYNYNYCFLSCNPIISFLHICPLLMTNCIEASGRDERGELVTKFWRIPVVYDIPCTSDFFFLALFFLSLHGGSNVLEVPTDALVLVLSVNKINITQTIDI